MPAIVCPVCSNEISAEEAICPHCGHSGVQKPYFELLLDRDGHAGEAEMLAALQQSGIYKLCYAHKSRVKPELKLLEKTQRKQREKPDYKLQDITDVIGIRFVTLLRKEMPLVFESMIDIINHSSPLNPNPFLKKRIDEIIIYHTNPNDQILIELKKIAKRKQIRKKIVTKLSKESYSSIHLVTRLNKKVDKLSHSEKDYFIPVEIQIRTVFEDAWGEIDHKYGYVIRSGKETGDPVANAESVLRHLKIMKQFSDACAEYADVIHLEATAQENEAIDTARVVSVGADDDIIETFKSLNVDPQHLRSYIDARALRVDAEAAQDKQRGAGLKLSLQAAEKFRVLSKCYNGDYVSAENKRDYLFYYYVRMNEALSLLLTNQTKSVRIALDIYESLEQKYLNFPLLKMRLGQAYGKLGHIEDSLQYLQESYYLISEFEKKGSKYSDTIPKADYSHMKVYLPKIFGYYLWNKASKLDSVSNLKDKVNLISQAYELTEKAFQAAPENLSLNNNLLYYSMDIKSLTSGTDLAEAFPEIDAAIERHLKRLEAQCPLPDCKDIDVLDTMSKAYDLLGDDKMVLNIIDILEPLIENTLVASACDRDIILQGQREAMELRKKYATKP